MKMLNHELMSSPGRNIRYSDARLECVAVSNENSVFTSEQIEELDTRSVARNKNGHLMICYSIDRWFAVHSKRKYIKFKYFDQGTGSLFLEYESWLRPNHTLYKLCATPAVSFQNSHEWKEVAFEVSDGAWKGQIDGADFRITVQGNDQARFLLTDPVVDDEFPGNITVIDSHLSHLSNNPHVAAAFSTIQDIRSTDLTAINLQHTPDVSIIIPVCNKSQFTIDCLKSIATNTTSPYEVIVVDNGSTDNTYDLLSGIENIIYIRLDRNYNFAYACNLGVKHATSGNVLFLNNDTIVMDNWLPPLLDVLSSQPNVGVVGAKLIYPLSGSVQHAGIEIGRDSLPRHRLYGCPAHDPRTNASMNVIAVTGACLLTTKDLFNQVNGFDEVYINGYEDVDLCFKIRKTGLDIIYCAESKVFHYESISEGRLNAERNRANLTTFASRWPEYLIASELEDIVKEEVHLPVVLYASDPSLNHNTGCVEGQDLVCIPNFDKPGHCIHGPSQKFYRAFDAVITFFYTVDNPVPNSTHISLDVYDRGSDEILIHEDLNQDVTEAGSSSHSLEIKVEDGHLLEYRVYWHGNCHLTVHKIILKAK